MTEPCNCESAEHFDEESARFNRQRGHDYMKVPAGQKRALYVGRVCDECATTHMAKYIIAGTVGGFH